MVFVLFTHSDYSWRPSVSSNLEKPWHSIQNGKTTFLKYANTSLMDSLQHFKRSFKPTDVWYENEHRELMLIDSSKESPILAFKRGSAYANRSSTEV